MFNTKIILTFVVVTFIVFSTKATKKKIWLEGHVKKEILRVQNHHKSRSATIAFLVTRKSQIFFQSSTSDLKDWYFILDDAILDTLKMEIDKDEIFDWEVINITLKEPIKKKIDCTLKDLYISCFFSHITKQTVRHLVSSHTSHIAFAKKLRAYNTPLIEGLLENGDDGYIYLTELPIESKDIKNHRGILNGFFIFESKKIKTCW